MRIRSIRPEFWTSEDVAAMDWHTRLVYIGLWSYVDDNGVGRDNERLIAAALFPLDDDQSEVSRRVAAGILDLAAGGQIVRYVVDGVRYLHVVAWTRHQRTDNAGKQRYPLPTSANTELAPPVQTGGGELAATRGDSRLGEGEKGRRGEGEKSMVIADAMTDRADPPKATSYPEEFERWWSLYPSKTGKGAALAAWRKARKKATPEQLAEGVTRYTHSRRVREGVVKNPSTWLNQECWLDAPDPPATHRTGRDIDWQAAYDRAEARTATTGGRRT